MLKRYPMKFSDLTPNGESSPSEERITIEAAGKGKAKRWFIQVTPGTAISPKRARVLAQWLLDAADWIENKTKKPVEHVYGKKPVMAPY